MKHKQDILMELDLSDISLGLSDIEVHQYLPKLLERCHISPKQERKKKISKTGLLLVAIFATFCLAGAGYLYSAYFQKLYQPDRTYEEMTRSESSVLYVTEQADLNLGEFSPQSLKDYLDEMEPGSIVTGTAKLDGKIVTMNGIRSQTYGSIRIVDQNGAIDFIKGNYLKKDPATVVKQAIDNHIFTAVLESSSYSITHANVSLEFPSTMVVYEDAQKNSIYVSTIYGHQVLLPEDQVSAQDISIKGNTFTLVDYNGEINLVYYIADDYAVELRTSAQEKTTEVLEKAAESLNVYNVDAVKAKPYEESLAKFPDQRIQDHTKEIAEILLASQSSGSNNGWSFENIQIQPNGTNNSYIVEYKDVTFQETLLKNTPLPVAPPFEKESWFPMDQFTKHRIYAGYLGFGMAGWYSEDGKIAITYQKVYGDGKDTLDILTACLNHSVDQPTQIRQEMGGIYLYCKTQIEGQHYTVIYTAVQDGDFYHIFKLTMPEQEIK